ncbi:endonuclease/exonuclease/phosphatase family protein [Luteolibacter sp. AS25]|uniref:endonuclease/exonuclease/phosphatase family protein n=1 Tax=Luteolibacter sp. AS25 TaxID=3135776 RepID=UPI00398BB3D6
MSNLRRATGWAFVIASLLTHIITVWCYAKQPDSLAAFTVLPFWFWGGIGLLLSVFAFCFLRAPLSLIITAVWAITLSVAMDEAKGLSNFTHPKITAERGPTDDGATTLRVATINCALFRFGDPAAALKEWDPDIVLLQETLPHRVKQISEMLYGGNGDYRAYLSNGIVTRHEITREVRNPLMRNQQATIRLRNGREIEIVNLHLATAAIDMRLWSSESRRAHVANRKIRRRELSVVLQVLEQTSSFPTTPTILGGDFNAGATDVVHRQLIRDFEDSFGKVGRGWGDTFHRRFPILRIDHIYATRQFQPISSGVVVSKDTDHRIVVSDFILRD